MPRKRLTFHLNLVVLGLALLVTVADALTKAWARHALRTHAIHVIAFVWFRLAYNSGISFSFNHTGPLWLTIVTVLIALAVVSCGLTARRGLPTLGFGLLIGGGVANVIDRLSASPHRVTDFVAVGSFYIFNLADACITVGFIVLVIAGLRGEALLNT